MTSRSDKILANFAIPASTQPHPMSLSPGLDVSLAAATAALGVDFLIHPVDTLITRTQSPAYTTHYKTANGSFNRALFQGLYQGFGPTLVTGMPAAAAFFTIYEGLKKAAHDARAAGHLQGVPLPVLHGASSAAADLVACAIINPAEVIKQNAQVCQQGEGPRGRHPRSPTVTMLRKFAKQPTRLWAGYTTLAASSIPGTCLMFLLYEGLAARLLGELDRRDGQGESRGLAQRVQVHTLSAGVAGACSSLLFVPVDVVKTRMRLAAGSQKPTPRKFFTAAGIHGGVAKNLERVQPPGAQGPLRVAQGVFRAEGLRGLFRGGTLTCVAAGVGSGLGLGCYEGFKQYFQHSPKTQDEVFL
ncbi:S-adenosylmethionine mitochondrial carrier protein [Colletotrichum tanaceti]|uniref:S-adenosylmethionine mitochondrial carrier protein n=1 Tax=Colletotrichum tanaceti TaxID=1306861 RepID=A0A4U6XHY2_9PEZI|nr:S-adenosylmethionine mitochondrial carrier protein [Colletotrichum tanaceti]TKW55381.1 S-adenosylmethionine mitochondrial carrier protein [Colletotrichum tanaceti]